MKNFFKHLFSSGENEADNHVSSFNEQQEKEEDVQFIDHGVKTVDLNKIIGSVGIMILIPSSGPKSMYPVNDLVISNVLCGTEKLSRR